eukprot:m.73199 g.73199  ORF g.73199 m.73199 type:complete len:115 (-) comp12389_c0_seq2:286-630(-)
MHVMDIVSKIDKSSTQTGEHLQNLGGQLFFKADVFKKGTDYEKDPKATEIIFHQIQAEIKAGLFVCKSDDDYHDFAAMMYYVRFGEDVDTKRVVSKILVSCFRVRERASQEKGS